MTDAELEQALDSLRSTMISVATGGHKIDDVNAAFKKLHSTVVLDLKRRGIKTPLPYGDLWDWYGRWSNGDMPSYKSRRTFISEQFAPLIQAVRTGQSAVYEATGWERVDRAVGEIRDRLATASNEEQYQAVGLLCREVLISLAQAVYVAKKHPSLDGVQPSETDAKRKLEAFIQVEMSGASHEEARKHIRSVLDLSVSLQHKRTATYRDAAICVEATTGVINIVAIVSGRRDP